MKFKGNYCKEYKIKKAELTYDLIPDDILIPYAIFWRYMYFITLQEIR